jgi:predicted deacylase
METGRVEQDATARKMAEAVDIEYVLTWPSSGGNRGTTHSAAAAEGVPAVLAEIGGLGVWSDHDATRFSQGVRNVMTSLGMINDRVVRTCTQRQLAGWVWHRAPCEGLLFCHVGSGDVVVSGQPLATITDLLGSTVHELMADRAGLVIFRVASLAINRDDPVLAVAFEG